jgi:hypothetical protein
LGFVEEDLIPAGFWYDIDLNEIECNSCNERGLRRGSDVGTSHPSRIECSPANKLGPSALKCRWRIDLERSVRI